MTQVDPIDPADIDLDEAGRGLSGELLVALAASARTAGRQAVVSGRWFAETVVETAPRVPIRDAARLSAQHDGLTGAALAGRLVRSAGRVSGGIAATTGGIIAAQQLSVAGLLLVPFELAAETAFVVLVELKLVTELHQVAGRALPGGPVERTGAAVMSWMSGRAAPANRVAAAVRGDVLGPGGHRQLRRELRSRYTKNISTVAPLLTGAAAAGYLNRRATLDVGRRVAGDLGLAR
jgi:hypothetical protein